MTKDDIIRMAREAGFDDYEQDEMCIRFAKLVVANIDPKSFMSWQEGYEAGVLAERAECAKLCGYGDYLGNTYAAECAAAIRARGTT